MLFELMVVPSNKIMDMRQGGHEFQHLREASSESFFFTAFCDEVEAVRDGSPLSLLTSVVDTHTQFPGAVASFLSAPCVLLTRFASVVKVRCALSLSFFSTLLLLVFVSSPFCDFEDVEALRTSVAILPDASKVAVTGGLAAVLCRARAEFGAIDSSETAIQPEIRLCANKTCQFATACADINRGINLPCSRCISSCIFFNCASAFDAWACRGSSTAGMRLSNTSKASDNVAVQRENLPARGGDALLGSCSDVAGAHCKECVGRTAGVASPAPLGVSGSRAGVLGSRRAQALVTNKDTFSCVKGTWLSQILPGALMHSVMPLQLLVHGMFHGGRVFVCERPRKEIHEKFRDVCNKETKKEERSASATGERCVRLKCVV